MCTVTYIPTKKGFIFTSNRDEQPSRKTIKPSYYTEDGVNLFYPKDEVAGGTWIGVSEQKRLVCLLNGGFVYHDPKLKFPKSRGVVVKTLLKTNDLFAEMNHLDLTGVAPFTLIAVDWKNDCKVYELVWCREKKKVKELDANTSNIWSSSTLYTDEMKELRKEWFKNNQLDGDDVKVSEVLGFHQNKTLGEETTSPKMKRDVVETISTTMVVKENADVSMSYYDYTSNEELSFANLFALTRV